MMQAGFQEMSSRFLSYPYPGFQHPGFCERCQRQTRFDPDRFHQARAMGIDVTGLFGKVSPLSRESSLADVNNSTVS